MKIKTIRVSNYGPFSGTHELDFNTAGLKNVVLVGGLNGSGKSSIFMGLKLCLYGRGSIGGGISQKDYQEYLRKLIHLGNGVLENNEAFVEVSFNISTAGKVDEYAVRRTWRSREKSVAEVIEVTRNGAPLDIFEQSQWQEFIQHLIPQGMLDLFFFDGERISRLTAQSENIQLSQSVQTLFGLNTIKQLKSDLRYIEKAATKGVPTELKQAVDDISQELSAKKGELESLVAKAAELRTHKDGKTQALKQAEQRLHIKGGAIGISRKALNEQISVLQEESSLIKKEMIALFQSELPFAFAGAYLDVAVKALSEEVESRGGAGVKTFEEKAKKNREKIEGLLKSKKDFNKILEMLFGVPQTRSTALFDDLSENSIREIAFWFSTSSRQKQAESHRLSIALEKKIREITEAHSKLEHVPDEDDIKEEVLQINSLYREIGALEAEILAKEQAQSKVEQEIRALERKEEEIGGRLDDLAAKDRQSLLVAKSIKALAEFEVELVKNKISSLENNFLACFNQLLRKGDVLKSIHIDPSTFRVTLKNKHDREVELLNTSEGEKQIYAISLLHAITKTSNCSFPIIIDTPMGRLDAVHKNNLVENYFPHASHQVIILSTDTEIDSELATKLNANVARSYTLQFSRETSSTNVEKGFFKKELV